MQIKSMFKTYVTLNLENQRDTELKYQRKKSEKEKKITLPFTNTHPINSKIQKD